MSLCRKIKVFSQALKIRVSGSGNSLIPCIKEVDFIKSFEYLKCVRFLSETLTKNVAEGCDFSE